MDATAARVRPKEHPRFGADGRWFVIGGRRYDLTELSHLRTVRGPHDSPTIKAMVTLGVILAALVGVMVASRADTPIQLSAVPALGAALLLPLVLASVGYRMRPRPFELWAEYRGLTVQLFYSESEREYNQVCRALVRAREMARLGPSVNSWASLDPWSSMPR
jgi:hypothetical protein